VSEGFFSFAAELQACHGKAQSLEQHCSMVQGENHNLQTQLQQRDEDVYNLTLVWTARYFTSIALQY
jgi:hypothetical protein